MVFFLGILAILFQGLFSGSETAILRTNWLRILLVGKRRLSLLQEKDKLILTSLIGTNVFVVLSAFAFSYYFVSSLGQWAITLAIVWTSLLSLIFGEFLPKAMAKEYPEAWYNYLYPFLAISHRFFSPFIKMMVRILPAVGRERRQELKLRREDLLSLYGKERSSLIARAVLEFSSRKVRDVMTPLRFTVALRKDSPPNAIYHILSEYGYSRYPVYEEKKEKIIGVIHTKDLLSYPEIRWRRPYFVSSEKKVREVFAEMRRGKDEGLHLAVVVDKTGKAIGILTLEDILEEIVGEIRSEV